MITHAFSYYCYTVKVIITSYLCILYSRGSRQMLSGVDTLRMIASTLENRHRFDDQPEFSEPENQDDSGPAL